MAKLADPKYYIKMRLEIEELIQRSTVRELVDYIKTNGQIEDEDSDYSYMMKENYWTYDLKNYGEGKIGDEFHISESGRLFFAVSLIRIIEITD